MNGSLPRAIVLDVDGTLYRQGPLRRRMAVRLAQAHWHRPWAGLRTARGLAAYRGAQEILRHSGEPGGAHRQLELAAHRCGQTVDVVADLVARWMDREPLPHLLDCRRPGLAAFLEQARGAGIRLGVFSDYPAHEKLEALGIRGSIDVVVCAQDADVGVFKPNPLGIEIALQRLGTVPGDALYVGDRHSVDAVAAAAAGVACVIVGGDAPTEGGRQAPVVAD
ncbi:MAG: HAD family hydrolase, partial [Armatimonadota bacterium]